MKAIIKLGTELSAGIVFDIRHDGVTLMQNKDGGEFKFYSLKEIERMIDES
jgi:hypothetical protein